MKKVAFLVFALLVFGMVSSAKDQTFTGVVSGSQCGIKHSTASADAAQCVEKCVSGGASYVLVSDGKVYLLAPQDKFKGLGGKNVTVKGTLNNVTITVTSVAQ